MNFARMIFSLFFVVAFASAIEIYPSEPSFTVHLPSDGSVLKDTILISANSEGEVGKEWNIDPESVAECNMTGLSISPLHSKLSYEGDRVIFSLNTSLYNAAYSDSCLLPLFVENESGSILLIINIDVVSDWCTYYGPSYCNNGTCNNVTHSCDCQENFYGHTCNTYCKKETTCEGHGVCSVNGTCNCDTTFYGKSCDIFCDPTITCSNKGQCSVNGTCVCNEYYFGYSCDTFCNATTMCSGHGSCDFIGTGCNCTNTHWGTHCENECACVNGYCNSTGHCVCDNHYFGEKCDIKCTEEDNCNGHGYCAEDGVSCVCFDDHFGSTCSVNKVVFGISVGLAGLLVVLIIGFFSIRACQRKNSYQQIQ